MSRLTIKNALVVPMTEERRCFDGYVRVKDGGITEAVQAPRELRRTAWARSTSNSTRNRRPPLEF